ncbi:MAG: PRTRC system protein B [Burkholderiaceae bacterium]|jgi:PRTRC genetic system protein B|nr:MAG: PRTRC system protein B [Burkholderiaceae bacterium]
MNQADFSIHAPTDGVLKLDHAVLIYRGSSGSALATVHEVEQIDGEPVIGAGRAMTPHSALALARALLKRVGHGGFLPDNVLFVAGDLILWWVRPAMRHVAFRVSERDAQLLGAVERGESVPHPGLVFAASGREWRVWAVKGSQRPTLATPLHQAPYFNVDGKGHICQGSVPKPDGTTAEKIGAWNDAFFRSFFTHPNVTAKLVRYPGGSFAFWRDMLDRRFARFPQHVLVPMNATLGALLGMKEGA